MLLCLGDDKMAQPITDIVITKDGKVDVHVEKEYNDFNLQQFVVNLPVGYSVEVLIRDDKNAVITSATRKFTANFINCHFNLIFQDKSTRKEELPS
jgi:hypothetical protein